MSEPVRWECEQVAFVFPFRQSSNHLEKQWILHVSSPTT